jgi:hypothetical protein
VVKRIIPDQPIAGEDATMMLSSVDSQALKVDITEKAAETAMACEKGCTTERKAMASTGDGDVNEEKLLVGTEVLQTPCSDSDISQPEEHERRDLEPQQQ